MKLKYEYSTILNKRIGNSLLKLKQRHFEGKPEKLSAYQLSERVKQTIHQIKSKHGDILCYLKQLNDGGI